MIALVLMVIREQRLRHAVAARHRVLVINAVRRVINTVVAVRDIAAEAELLVTVNTLLVTARVGMSGMEAVV